MLVIYYIAYEEYIAIFRSTKSYEWKIYACMKIVMKDLKKNNPINYSHFKVKHRIWANKYLKLLLYN